MATLKDIAQATGLSMNTVSRAIRGSGYVSLKTAELVRKTVKELDYHPNRAAQDLRRRKSRQITVVAESYDYLHIEKLAAIKEYAAEKNILALNPTIAPVIILSLIVVRSSLLSIMR